MSNYIIEVANCHGGNKEYLFSLLNEFSDFEGHGIKFQPLNPDYIATPDFEWYPVYQKLYFDNTEWKEIIEEARKTKIIWLDLFDVYGVEILSENLEKVYGIKFQASILYNNEVLGALQQLDCSSLKLIINISGIELEDIKERTDFFLKTIQPKELLLEVGFQSYPTQLEDSGLNKIAILKNSFNYRIVFADHIEGKLEDSITLPLVAAMTGADLIEKHVLHSTLKTEYDYYSAIDFQTYGILVEKIEKYKQLNSSNFINTKEKTYLSKSIQIPIARKNFSSGMGIDIINDLSYKRSGKNGLNTRELMNLLNGYHILSDDIIEKETLKKENFKKAIIGTVIAGRLKSTRLKRKAILQIGNLSSVERCVKSCLNFENTNFTILATSYNNEDSELKNHTYAESVIFYTGDPDNVIERYLTIAEKKDLDVIVRVTADMPYVSKEIMETLLDSHFKSGADYTAAASASVGTAPEIINVQALKEIKKYFPTAEYSEYMTWYFQNNSDHFKVNLVELSPDLNRSYRLTLDYQEDLDLFNKIQEQIDDNIIEDNIHGIFRYLDSNPKVSKINEHLTLKYKTDISLIETLNDKTRIK